MADSTQLYDAALLCLESLPTPEGQLAVRFSGRISFSSSPHEVVCRDHIAISVAQHLAHADFADSSQLSSPSAGVASLMLNSIESQLAFCPAASSEVAVLDLHSGFKTSTWATLARELDQQSSTQGSLVETTWAADGTALLRTWDGRLCAATV